MRIVIDILDEDYEYIKLLHESLTDYQTTLKLYRAVKNGTPLPKGHGRLKDTDKILYEIRNCEGEPNYQHNGEDWCVGMCMAESVIESAQTIIEIDKEANNDLS